MTRDTIIQFYTTDEKEEWLTDQAEAAGQSLSKYCDQVITEHIDREQDRQQYGRYGVDQQIELALDQIRDEATAILSNFQSESGARLDRIQRIRTVYVLALWHLLKDDYSSAQQEAALKRAAEHIGCDLSDDSEMQAAITSKEAQSSHSVTDQTSTALNDTNEEDR
ncbi:hypothetical protein [Haloarcula laminariae]|uniref:hypothetical protein n=1 Tax=Haloarcula laminariae TaxID=2961577 RepID=UPI0021C60E8E|nr:hypothetical protein [Halomicroarcula laminariae]